MYIHKNIGVSYFTTVNELWCETEQISTAYKAIVIKDDIIETGDIKHTYSDVHKIKTAFDCAKMPKIIIRGTDIDKVARDFLDVFEGEITFEKI